MNQQEKLRKKRLKQEEKIRSRRKKFGLFSRKPTKDKYEESEQLREEKYNSSKNDDKYEISQEEIEKTLENNSVTKEVSTLDGVPGETELEKEARLSNLRTEIYHKHKEVVSDKFEEAKEVVTKDTNKRLKKLEEEYKNNIEEHKNDLNETLESCTDADDRREARKNHRDSINEEKETFDEEKEQITKEHDEGLESLKDEYESKIEDLEEKYESDIDDIKEGYFTDNDLKLCKKEFEAETITFDTLDDYDTYGESDEKPYFGSVSSENATSSAINDFNIFSLITPIIGIGVMIMIGIFVMGAVTDSLEMDNQMNVSDEYSDVISIFDFDLNIPLLLLFAPLFLVIIYKVFSWLFTRDDYF